MFILDAHLDLAMNAVEWNRDLTKSVQQIRKSEFGMSDKPDRQNNTVSLDAMRKGNIGICVATQIARVSDNNELPGWNSQEEAWAHTQDQLAWYKSMEEINDKVDDLDIQTTNELKFNGCGLVISSEVIRSGVNIPKSVFFVHEDTAFMNRCFSHFQGQLPQYTIKNILLVHNRKLPNKRMYIKGQDFSDGDMTRMRRQQYWFKNADKMSQANAFSYNKQGYTYSWDDVFKEYNDDV